MPTPTYTPLANITLGSSAASVTFSSISQSYRDLVLVSSLRSTRTNTVDYPALRVNGEDGTSTNCSAVVMNGNGSFTNSFTSANVSEFNIGDSPAANATANIFTISKLNIMDYTATDKHKSVLYRWDNPDSSIAYTMAVAGRWASTSAITALQISFPYLSGNIAAGSSFALYGIAS